jgi:hypothetical protein
MKEQEKNSINCILKEIEKEENVKILLAVEAGSRAYGLNQQDSDYDVRFLYVRPIKEYLRLQPLKDVIEYKPDCDLDLSGWDIKKGLSLFHGCNPSVFEWLASNEIYIDSNFAKELRMLAPDYFSVRKSLHHYFNMAKRNYKLLKENEENPVKKYFSVLRPLLDCLWILQERSMPPLHFDEMLELLQDESIKNQIKDMMAMKRENKAGNWPFLKEMKQFMEMNLKKIEDEVSHLPYEKVQGWQALEELFLKTVRNNK